VYNQLPCQRLLIIFQLPSHFNAMNETQPVMPETYSISYVNTCKEDTPAKTCHRFTNSTFSC